MEHAALKENLTAPNVRIYRQDGLALAQSLCPPEPRRGVMLVDPSYEVKAEYGQLPKWLAGITRKWNVGVVMLWYPLLTSQAHKPMVEQMKKDHPDALAHEVRFPPAREGHRMIGSGLFIANPPYRIDAGLAGLSALFERGT